jgi:hypothetical protein
VGSDKEHDMHNTRLRCPALVAGAFATTILAAPAISAAPAPLGDCVVTISGSTCRSPGNVEVNNPRPAVNVLPYGTMPLLLGGR